MCSQTDGDHASTCEHSDDKAILEIETRWKAVVPPCPSYVSTVIRHVERNLDIDCPQHDGTPEYKDCNTFDRWDGETYAHAPKDIATLLAKIKELESIRKNGPAFDETCVFSTTPGDDGWICETHGCDPVADDMPCTGPHGDESVSALCCANHDSDGEKCGIGHIVCCHNCPDMPPNYMDIS